MNYTPPSPARQAAIDRGVAAIKARCPDPPDLEPVFGPGGPDTHYERVLAAYRNTERRRRQAEKLSKP